MRAVAFCLHRVVNVCDAKRAMRAMDALACMSSFGSDFEAFARGSDARVAEKALSFSLSYDKNNRDPEGDWAPTSEEVTDIINVRDELRRLLGTRYG